MIPSLLFAFAGWAAPDPASDLYAKVGPLLRTSDGRLTPEVRGTVLDWAEASVLAQLRAAKQVPPEAVLSEVRKDDTLRDAAFGSVFPPDPSILQNYARLRAAMGDRFALRYRSLLVAFAVARRTKGVALAGGPDVGRPFQPEFWTDETLRVPGSEAEKAFVRQIAAFMKETGTDAADLYDKPGPQGKLRAYLAGHGVAPNFVGEVRRTAGFGERLKNAMIALGQRPAARDPKPTAVEWLRHLAFVTERTPTSTPVVDGRAMAWPPFPLDAAPWPLLMPLSHAIPLSEADYVFEAFQGQHGPDRYHTYGPYLGDDDAMAPMLRPSKWFWDAWPDRIVHGGMCVPISKGTCDLYAGLGKPAMWAGQPGHANLISFQKVGGTWTAEVEQPFAGGPDVTFAQWYFDEVGHGIRFRDLYLWTGAEHQIGLALGMNVGLRSYVDTRMAAGLFRAMPEAERPTLGANLLRGATLANPYNPETWYLLAEASPKAADGATVVEAVMRHDPGVLVGRPGGAAPPMGVAGHQYWGTLAQFAARYAVLAHPAPSQEGDLRRTYGLLKTVPGLNADDLVGYVEKAPPAPTAAGAREEAGDVHDAFGLLRRGQRTRDGVGVPADEARARELFAKAAALGDPAAAVEWSRLTPTVPGVSVAASNTFGADQGPAHLVDGSGLTGALHDNEGAAQTMWHTGPRPAPSAPAKGLRPSPAWVRFDFARPTRFDSILIWNHNQATLTDRGFRRTRIYGTADGTTWTPLTLPEVVELPRAGGGPGALPTAIRNAAAGQAFRSVVVAADGANGNYGSDVYGLSEVRFAARRLPSVVPAAGVRVAASSTFEPSQAAEHLIDGSGMTGLLHDDDPFARTMWHTAERPAATSPAPGLVATPAWVRFDFDAPRRLDSVLVWNLNQPGLTDRGFRRTRFYGTSDGTTWFELGTAEILRASGAPDAEPFAVSLAGDRPVEAVIVAAEDNHGGTVYGLSAVRFVPRA